MPCKQQYPQLSNVNILSYLNIHKSSVIGFQSNAGKDISAVVMFYL